MILTKVKTMVLTALAAAALLVPVMATAPAGAQTIQDGLCSGANLSVAQTTDCQDQAGTSDRIDGLITQIINIFSIVVGLIAVIMIIVGGVKYITSGGDSGNVTGAKNTILYAVIGLVIVALAQLIVNFVLNTASSV